jgi:pSer/pThr/pTyr-binding forkhead associated (FHA) protein
VDINLVLLKKSGNNKAFRLPGAVTTLGRREDCDLRIPLADVSRRHCQIEFKEDAVKVRDIGSSNGTWLNGKKLEEETLLGSGDILKVGSAFFGVQINGSPDTFSLDGITASSEAKTASPKPKSESKPAAADKKEESPKSSPPKPAAKPAVESDLGDSEFKVDMADSNPEKAAPAATPEAVSAQPQSDSAFFDSLDIDLSGNAPGSDVDSEIANKDSGSGKLDLDKDALDSASQLDLDKDILADSGSSIFEPDKT